LLKVAFDPKKKEKWLQKSNLKMSGKQASKELPLNFDMDAEEIVTVNPCLSQNLPEKTPFIIRKKYK